MIRWLNPIGFALMLVATPAVHAANFDAGTLSANPYINFVHVPGAAVSFLDIYEFSVPVAGMAALSVQDHPLVFNAPISLTVLGTSGLSFSVYDTANNLVAGPSTALSQLFPAGAYEARVSGLTIGLSGGAYSFAASFVPETGTWAMFGIGLAAVGFAAYRRRRATVAT